MHRFFVNPESILSDKVTLNPQQTHQIRQVLRLGSQCRIMVLDNQGTEYEVVLTDLHQTQATGRIVQSQPAAGEPNITLTLYQSLLSRDKFEWILQKGTEIGITCFIPIVTQRSIVRDVYKVSSHKRQRWQNILQEAAEQSRRAKIPELKDPLYVKACLKDLSHYDTVLLASTKIQASSLAERLHEGPRMRKSVALFIGPEGGFSDQETDQARQAGVSFFGLGPRILRTETAAIVASTLVLYELGEYRT